MAQTPDKGTVINGAYILWKNRQKEILENRVKRTLKFLPIYATEILPDHIGLGKTLESITVVLMTIESLMSRLG